MRRRVLGVVASIALAGVGTFLTLSYVNSAEQRAIEGEETVEVLVVESTVVKGEKAADIASRLKTILVPTKVQAVGSVASLTDLEGMVAAVDLQPGEQVLESRFITEEEAAAEVVFQVPDGLLQVTVSLEPARALGWELKQGDLVAVIASFDPFQVQAVEPGQLDEFFGSTTTGQEDQPGLKTPNTTHIILHKVLVTDVDFERLPEPDDRDDAETVGVQLAPTGNLLVTLAVAAPDVEKIVFTAEHGEVWLAKEPPSASEEGTEIQTRGSIYR